MGVAGVDGNGQRTGRVIAGSSDSASRRHPCGRPLGRELRRGTARKLGLRYVTDDRMDEGVVARYGGLNIVLKQIGKPPFWGRGGIERRHHRRDARADRGVRRSARRARRHASARSRAGTSRRRPRPRALVRPRGRDYSKPTHGLDVATRRVRETIRELASRRRHLIVISTDLDELVDLCDRIAVMSRGRIAGVVDNGPTAQMEMGALMVGDGRRDREPRPPPPSFASRGRPEMSGRGAGVAWPRRATSSSARSCRSCSRSGTGAIILARSASTRFSTTRTSGPGASTRGVAGLRSNGSRRCCSSPSA